MLFGTDSPPTTTPVERALEMVRSLPVPEHEHERILGGNAAELFGIS
jgi:predicted TIM-barrel fold metal-dependent hydrolase